ncbi:MAG: hypothetical protein P8X55_04540, partial [Desulfosarcinaceae bacterium]
MREDFYNVVLRFDPGNEKACTEVYTFLKNFNKLDPVRVEKALGRGRVLLKRDITQTEALKLQQRIQIGGAVCEVERQTRRQTGGNDTPKANPAEKHHPGMAGREIVCPRCKTRQSRQIECRHCGVVFAKIRKAPQSVDNEFQDTPPQSNPASGPEKPVRLKERAKVFLPAFKRLQGKWIHWGQALQEWSQKPLNALLNCAVLFLTAFLLDVFLILVAEYLWFIYTATTVGEHYMKAYPEATAAIGALLAGSPATLAWEVVGLVLIANLLLALITQFFHVSRLYLDSGGFILKACWIAPSALGTAWLLGQREPLPPLVMAFLLTLLPTLCLLGGCLNLARTLLPELGAVAAELARALHLRENLMAALKVCLRKWKQIKATKETR